MGYKISRRGNVLTVEGSDAYSRVVVERLCDQLVHGLLKGVEILKYKGFTSAFKTDLLRSSHNFFFRIEQHS